MTGTKLSHKQGNAKDGFTTMKTIGAFMSRDEESARELQPVPNGPVKFRMKLTSGPRLLVVVRSTVAELAAALAIE